MEDLSDIKKITSSIVDLGTEQYHLYKVIGQGAYSKVHLALQYVNGAYAKHVACKVIKKRSAGAQYIHKFLPRELSILRQISHPNIITVLDIAEARSRVYIFMDYCKRGDLLDYIRTKGALTERRSVLYFRQIASAMHYLHCMDVAHRDLKCENIFLSRKNHLQIGDFGFARVCYDENTGGETFSKTFCGSAAYAAPEIIQGLPYNPKPYDIWSMGCVLYIMLTAQMPFDDANIVNMVQAQQNRVIFYAIHYNANFSNDLKNLLVALLEPEVLRRATIQQVVNAKWFARRTVPRNFQPIQCVQWHMAPQHGYYA